ncbi:MAG: FAD-dependent oxidoreductase [candidate division KSB1 bacterium]
MKTHDDHLGLTRPITRRDFLQGIAGGIAGAALGCNAKPDTSRKIAAESNIPRLTGLRGQDFASAKLGHRVRDGEFRELPPHNIASNEEYDLIVIGAGLAGLTAAYVYQHERKGRGRILILDNHDDFGGHARRNTFEWNGTTLIAPGGTFALEDPDASPPEAVEIFNELGIDPARLESFRDNTFKERFKLSSGVFFDPRVFGNSAPQWVNRFFDIPYEKFFAQAPIPEAARRELIELYSTRKNYLSDETTREQKLAEMSWEKFIREVMGLSDHAVRFANIHATDLVGLGCDAVSALEGYHIGPGFFGMGGEGFYEKNGVLHYGYEPTTRYPDGNHTIARHLLKAILPEAVSGENTMEGVFNSEVNYAMFDRESNNVRVRLRSMAVRIEHEGRGDAQRVVVHYTQPDGRVYRVTARSAIMAGWGMVAKHIVPELPQEQVQALDQYRYTSVVYINVLLRHWRPMAELGLFDMYLPGGYCSWMNISDPLHVGSYRPEYHPDKPILLNMYKYLYSPGYDPTEQMIMGRLELENKPFEEFEREIRTELNLLFGPWGFNAADDILAITVNRWGHGYNFFKGPASYESKKHPPYIKGRERLGRISFAGADAGGSPWTQLALQQGMRAAKEQLEQR